MLPVFTITFVLGLILGSYLSYFPLERGRLVGRFRRLAHVSGIPTHGWRRRRSQVLFACVVGGCLYWTLFALVYPPRSNS